MQSLKCWLAVGVAVCALSVRGDDTEAQAKAREALQQKLNELQGQSAAQPAPAKSATKPPPAKPAPAKQAPKAAEAPAVPASTFTTPPTNDAAAIEKARAAMREKMNTLQPVATEVPPPAPAPKITVQPPAEPAAAPAATSTPPPVAAPPPVAPPPVVAAPAAVVTSSVVSSSSPPAATPAMPDLPPPSDPDAIAKAREALRQKMNELQAGQPTPATQPPATPPSAPAPAVPAAPPATASATAIQPPSTPELTAPPEADPAAIAKAREAMRLKMQAMGPEPMAANALVSTRPGKTQTGMNFPAMSAPPLGISATKEQRLQQLLQQYRSDLISPEQYQAGRAKILAEP